MLEIILQENKNHYELGNWIPNCVECLKFAIDNEILLEEKPELLVDILKTLQLLYYWIVEEKEWAYIELYQKFRTIYSNVEVGKALKEISKRLNIENSKELGKNFKGLGVEIKNKNMYEILEELSVKWGELSN
jgi:hypothetical protein